MHGVMMQCGHAANATCEGKPCCAICTGSPGATLVAETPNLEGRQARCSYCNSTQPSSTKLAFFEYRGPGSQSASQSCKCGYHWAAHVHDPRRVVPTSVVERGECSGFQSKGGSEYDSYYCGCRGWD